MIRLWGEHKRITDKSSMKMWRKIAHAPAIPRPRPQNCTYSEQHGDILGENAEKPPRRSSKGERLAQTGQPRTTHQIFLGTTGAGEGIRTLDPNLGKVVLYP
jgi:hypothetical protein